MSWTDKFDPLLLKMVKEVDTQMLPQLAAIELRILENVDKVFTSSVKHHVLESYLTGLTGYGHNDEGRDGFEEIYADVLGGEELLVRPQLVLGTVLFGVACLGLGCPGDEIFYITGKPYDTC